MRQNYGVKSSQIRNLYMTEKHNQTNEDTTSKFRQDSEPPAVTKQGWRYHHIGIPTKTPRPDEQYLPNLKMYVSGFETSPYGIEWMRFETGCPVSELVKTIPHVAFEVDDLNAAIRGRTLLGKISSPSEGVKVAMIIDNGAPVELLEFQKQINKSKTNH